MTDQDPRLLLTEAQLACLRAARTKVTNKNIAIALGISPNTVAQHLKEARLRLGDVTRPEAVEIVDSWDQRHPHNSTSAPESIAPAPNPGPVRQATARTGAPGTATVNAVREERVQFGSSREMPKPTVLRLVMHWLESFNDELTGAERSGWIIKLALAAALILFVVVSVGESLQRTLTNLGY